MQCTNRFASLFAPPIDLSAGSVREFWGYRASGSKLDRGGVVILAGPRNSVLCRTVHNQQGLKRACNVQHVRFGNIINFYYVSTSRAASAVGAFEVIRRDAHPLPHAIGRRISETSMYEIDDALIKAVDTHGVYQRDPVLGRFTGWLLRSVGKAAPYDARLFPGRSTLVRLDPRSAIVAA